MWFTRSAFLLHLSRSPWPCKILLRKKLHPSMLETTKTCNMMYILVLMCFQFGSSINNSLVSPTFFDHARCLYNFLRRPKNNAFCHPVTSCNISIPLCLLSMSYQPDFSLQILSRTQDILLKGIEQSEDFLLFTAHSLVKYELFTSRPGWSNVLSKRAGWWKHIISQTCWAGGSEWLMVFGVWMVHGI